MPEFFDLTTKEINMPPITYPLDMSGISATNLIIDELHSVQESQISNQLFIVPNYSPFFVSNFSMTIVNGNITTPLVENVDYSFALQYITGTRVTGKAMYGALTLHNINLNGILKITYQTIGGDQVADRLAVLTALSDKVFNPRTTVWDTLINVPNALPPVPHYQDYDKFFGQEEVVRLLGLIRDAILQNSSLTSDNITSFINQFMSDQLLVSSNITKIVQDIEIKASNSATLANNHEQAALASLTDFKNTYYGALTTDPATAPSGGLVKDGALYFNTTSGKLRIYQTGAWYDTSITAATFSLITGSSLIGHTQIGTGAINRTVQSRLRDEVLSTDFGVATGVVATDTATIQAALNTGKSVRVIGNYVVQGLVMSVQGQEIHTRGYDGYLIKGANGPIITLAAQYCLIDVPCRGESNTPIFTGDNIVITANNCEVKRDSFWAFGRAIKSTGNTTRIHCGMYQTADTTATGYDIEIGQSGVLTLYHEIHGYYSSQDSGGILLIDTGSHKVIGGQFGKYTIQAGSSPAGVNGGMCIGSRVTGNVSIGLSNAIMSSCQFSGISINLLPGTSNCRFDSSNVYGNGYTITNNGNVSNYIAREVSTGGSCQFKLGDDTSLAITTTDLSTGDVTKEGWLIAGKGKGYTLRNTAGTAVGSLSVTGDNLTLVNTSPAGYLSMTAANSSIYMFAGNGGSFYLGSNNSYKWLIDTNGYFKPTTDNSVSLGTITNRPTVIYSVSGTINTSDKREKQDIRPLNEKERAVGIRLKGLIKTFKWIESVKSKGDNARIHCGVVADEVEQAFIDEGLDPSKYGIWCYDEWEASPAVITPAKIEPAIHDENGELIKPEEIISPEEITSPAIEAGNRKGIRYDQLFAFIIAVL